MPPGYREFEFDLPRALLAHLVETFDSMEDAPLTPAAVTEIPEAQGVYQLFHQRKLVYVGKTDAEAGLRQRLGRHAWTVQHRRNLDTEEVSFKAVRVFVFTAMDLETQMIKHYRRKESVPWNDSGFGSNDPGKERDTTNARAEGFDAQFPVDLDRTVTLNFESPASGFSILAALRRWLPYTLRFELEAPRSRKGHSDLYTKAITLPPAPLTTRQLLVHVITALPPGWQGTLLAGRVILYKQHREFTFGEIIARS